MREFMTKMSDYWKERRNDPDKQENKLTVIITAAVAVVIIVLLLVLLWGYVGKRYGGRETALPEQTEQVMQEADQKENQMTRGFPRWSMRKKPSGICRKIPVRSCGRSI